jgi:hypothetical protein
LPVDLFIPKPNYSIVLVAKISCSRRVSSFFLVRGMLASGEFDNQALLDATKIGKVRTNPVPAAEFEAAHALGSEMLPQFPFRCCGLGTKPPASFTWAFIISIHNRALRRRADEGPPLSAWEGAGLPLTGGDAPFQHRLEDVETPDTGYSPCR